MESVTPLVAVTYATSTAVRLLPENSIIHNHKYFVLCTGAEVPWRRTVFDGRGTKLCTHNNTEVFLAVSA
jgi:hypothetical protein